MNFNMMPSHLCLLVLNCFLGAASSVRVSKGRTQDRSFLLSASEPLSDDLDQDMVLQHMSRLYEKYNRENRLREGNTVRSVRAIQAFSDHRMVYQLNLTTLQDSEVILSATFHFLLERHSQQQPWFCKRYRSPSCRSSAIHPSISLLFRSISSGSEVRSRSLGSFLGNVTFHPQRRGVWQMKDVTQVIKEAWNEGHRLVSVQLDIGQYNKRKPEEVLSAGDLPYLLVYANDQALAEPNSVAASLQRYDPFHDEGELTQSSQLLHRPIISLESKERVRRKATLPSDLIQNNELPEVDFKPDGYRKDDLWESAWYLKLKPKSGRKEEKRKSRVEELVVQSRGEHNGDEVQILKGGGRASHDDLTVKLFKDSRTRTISDGRRHERKNKGKDVKKHKGHANTQSPVLSFDEETMRNARRKQWSNNQHRACSRRNLRVDFADIGWSEWVIAPKAFEAYYCTGTCGFPMPKVSRPSNHATIQSIVRAVGIIPGVPEPCCVPEKMSPLAVLYQDESRNPVLKIYPNMSIQSCSCR